MGCKNIGIRKFEFVAKAQILYETLLVRRWYIVGSRGGYRGAGGHVSNFISVIVNDKFRIRNLNETRLE